jgi:hypothetical protein
MTNDLRLPKSPTLEIPVNPYEPYAVETFGELVQSVTFRLKDGCQFAKPYHWLSELSFDPSTGIRLHYSDADILIHGRNLRNMFTLLSEYKIRWLQEVDRPTSLLLPDSVCVIERVSKSIPSAKR